MIADEGFVYVLQNDSHDNLVLKIGLTRGKPEIRAKQLYWGSTGVPEHFDVVVAYSVGNCVIAENLVHSRLDTYRVNQNREFFKIDPRVAQVIVLETCREVNGAMGLGEPVEFRFTNKPSKNYIKQVPVVDNAQAYIAAKSLATIKAAIAAPVNTSKLSPSQVNRIRIVKLILGDVFDMAIDKFIQSFTQDQFPEREIVVWENIAKVYQQFNSSIDRTEEERHEAFQFILYSSMLTGKDLGNMIEKCKLSYEAMMSIVDSMRP